MSRDGRFYGKDERAARWGATTHIHCEQCGKPCPKHWLLCEKCREEKAAVRYAKYPKIKWDETTLTYSPITDRYYFNRDEVCCEYEFEVFDPVGLQLVLCDPIYATEIDPVKHYEDLLPDEDCDLPEELIAIFEELNQRIREEKIILSYEPTNKAVGI